MRTISPFLLALLAGAAVAAQPDFFMGTHADKLPAMKRAAALAAKNPACHQVLTGVYLPPGQQTQPGKAYLITCDAPGQPGRMLDLYFGAADLRAGRVARARVPASPAQAWARCKAALGRRYAGQQLAIRRVRISDNGTANRRIDALLSSPSLTVRAWCIVPPTGKTETHIAMP